MITIVHGLLPLVPSGEGRTTMLWEGRAGAADVRSAVAGQPSIYATFYARVNSDHSVGLRVLIDDLQSRYAGLRPLAAELSIQPGETLGLVDFDENGYLRRPVCLVTVGLVHTRW